MSWVTIIWAMIASACLTLALVHVLVWWRRRDVRANLLFSLTAVATAVFAGCELWMMRAETPGAFGTALRWTHVPAWVLIVSLVGFVRLYLRAGRLWLAWTVCGLRTLSLILNFVCTPNLNYREITALRHILFLGESVSVAEGVPNPWTLIGQLSLLLLIIFIADAAITVWRRGDRRQALSLGGSMFFFVVAGTGQATLTFWGVIHAPITTSLFFMGIVAAMGYELSQDVLRAARLSDELHESQQGMRLAAAAAKLALWTWDIPRNLVWVALEGRPLFGFAPHAEITLERFLATLHAEDRAPVQEAVHRSLHGEGEFLSDYRVLLPEGAVRWITARGRVEFDGHGQPLRMRGVSLDITERKLAELEAQQHRNEVAHLSRVTTLGEISGSLAHELNQPLGAILAYTEAAELHLQSQTPNLDQVRDILAHIHKEDLRAGEIIHGIRTFLRRRELERQPLDVAQLVEEAVRLLSSDAAARKTTMGLEIPADLPRVTGDRIHLQQVLLNMLVNGMDAMSTHPVADRRITIRATALDPHTVEIAVSDAGVGIPPGELSRVFDPFHTTKQGGLGLGLAISRSIVEAHGGSISVQNNPDRGATARFTLPACEEGPPR